MEGQKAYRMWMWLVGLLMVANVGLIATIWLKPGPKMPPSHMPPVNFKERLNFTADQNAHFQQLNISNRAKIDSLKRLGKAAREQFFDNLKNDHTNVATLDSLGNILGNFHKLIEMQTYSHFRDVRNLLDARQKPIFDSLINDVLTSLPEQPHFKGDGIGPKGPPPGGPHPPDGMDGPQPGESNGPPPPGEMGGPPPPGPPQNP